MNARTIGFENTSQAAKGLAGALGVNYTVLLMVMAVAVVVQGEILFDRSQNLRSVPSFWQDWQKKSDTELLGFNEEQGVYFADDSLIVQELNKWDTITDLRKLHVKGVRVSSHMVYFHKETNTKRSSLVAEVEFSDSIIGFLADNTLFEITNPLFVPNPDPVKAKKANSPSPWSLEEKGFSPLDTVTMLSARRIRISWTNNSATDPLRVFTLDKKTTPLQRPSVWTPAVVSPACTRVVMSPPSAGVVFNLRGQLMSMPASPQVILKPPQGNLPAGQ